MVAAGAGLTRDVDNAPQLKTKENTEHWYTNCTTKHGKQYWWI